MDIYALNQAFSEEYNVPIEKIHPDSNIWITFELDSLRALQISVIVHKLTGVVIYPRQLPRLATFQALYDYIIAQKENSQS